ncbi:unnamed protein product [Owenia fusiformis]|uniref:PDZ domain-containing protein n=1 Tax=Owenia fusiformis TaxID=6347 RepID=A0A8S4Q460_OWEFU|nr:unnamed protein product [Owenia fusiformis]
MPAPVPKHRGIDSCFGRSKTMDTLPNTIRVRLTKRADSGLGFMVKENTDGGGSVTISDLISGGVAEESGLVQIGDTIVRINETDFTQLSYSQGVSFLKTITQGISLVMLLRGPPGCSTHLETIFNTEGSPRTVRVTQPLCGINDEVRVSPSKVQKRVPALTPSPIMSPVLGHRRFISRHKSAPSIQFGGDNSSPGHSPTLGNVPTNPFAEHNGIGANQEHRQRILKDNRDGSPKITLTRSDTLRRSSVDDVAFSCHVNEPNRPDSPSLEIHQNKDELTIIVRGELKIQQHNDNMKLESGLTDNCDLNVKENGHTTVNDVNGDSNSNGTGENNDNSKPDHERLSRKDKAVRRNNTSPGILNHHSSIKSPVHSRKSSPSCDRRRRSGSSQCASRRGSSVSQTPVLKKYIRVKNVQDASIGFNDTLHQKSTEVRLW